MDTIVQCECGEQATCNNGNDHSDYRCTHCGNYYAVKYMFKPIEPKLIPLDVQLQNNRREWRGGKFVGYW